MKKEKTNKLSKQIICIIIVLMLCNFIVPNFTYAANDEDSGTIFAPISKFITFLCDSIMQFLQNTFTSVESINQGDGTYNFQYSPAIIFSGTVPAFDINFITPNTNVKESNNYGKYVRDHVATCYVNRNQEDKEKFEYAKNRDKRFVIEGRVPLQQVRDTYIAYYWVENETLCIAYEFDSGWVLIRR